MVLAGAELAGGRLPRVRRNPVATRCIFRDPVIAREKRVEQVMVLLSKRPTISPPASSFSSLASSFLPENGYSSVPLRFSSSSSSLIRSLDDARWTVKHIEDGGNRFHSGSGRSSPAAWRGHGKQVARRQWRRLANRSGRDSSFERTIGLPALPVSRIRYLISIFEGGGKGKEDFAEGFNRDLDG